MADSDSQSREPIENVWGGVTKWDCPFCPRDSFDRADEEAHIAFAHPEPGLSVTEALAADQAAPAAPESPVAVAPSKAPAPPVQSTPSENVASSDDASEKGE